MLSPSSWCWSPFLDVVPGEVPSPIPMCCDHQYFLEEHTLIIFTLWSVPEQSLVYIFIIFLTTLFWHSPCTQTHRSISVETCRNVCKSCLSGCRSQGRRNVPSNLFLRSNQLYNLGIIQLIFPDVALPILFWLFIYLILCLVPKELGEELPCVWFVFFLFVVVFLLVSLFFFFCVIMADGSFSAYREFHRGDVLKWTTGISERFVYLKDSFTNARGTALKDVLIKTRLTSVRNFW